MNKRQTANRIIEQIDDKYILEAIQVKKESRIKIFSKNMTTIAAGLLVASVLSFSSISAVVAMGNITAYHLLEEQFLDFAEKLYPVFVSCEDNGIKMEVEAINVEGDTAQVYISMQDLTGNRMDETIDLFDSYVISSKYDQMGGCTFVDYSAEDKKATFLITVQNMNGEIWQGSRMEFSVSEFIYGKQEFSEQLTAIETAKISKAQNTQKNVALRGWGGTDDDNLDTNGEYLVENATQSFSPVEGVTVTAYGFIDGQLHVQVYYENISETDNHGYIYLKDKEGNVIDSSTSVAFWDDRKLGSYEEYFIDISPNDDLSKYTIWGDFTTCKDKVEGDWKVSFSLEDK